MAEVLCRNVVKAYDGGVQAVKGIDLHIADHEFVVLVGPSGCGKSTMLRMIAGLEEISSGEIWIDGHIVNDVLPRDRDIAMVFQNYALYPHMSAFDNMSFGLKLRKLPKDEIKRRVAEAARILDIAALLDRKPKALSGGQRQRVAMGRAIVRNPKVFLFDEPLSNLDAKLRVQLRTEIKKVHQTVHTTTVYVTHDQIEAMTLADRVVVMNQGIIEQVGAPQELYHHPATRFVAGFIGSPAMNFLPCLVEKTASGIAIRVNSQVVLPIPRQRIERYEPYVGLEMIVGLRPEHVFDYREADWKPGYARIDAPVCVVEPMGLETMVHFFIDSHAVCARCEALTLATPGEMLSLMADMNNMHLIEPASGRVV
jgi:multiple sugar transport system ATP-binding protein